jgi:nitrate/nitrite transporter NarK
MKNHMLWMIIGCVLPLLFIFILPAFGVSSQAAFVIFFVFMFACHFLMLGHHHGQRQIMNPVDSVYSVGETQIPVEQHR